MGKVKVTFPSNHLSRVLKHLGCPQERVNIHHWGPSAVGCRGEGTLADFLGKGRKGPDAQVLMRGAPVRVGGVEIGGRFIF